MPCCPARAALPASGDKAHKLAARLRGVQDMDDLYLSLVSEWQDPAQVVRGQGGAGDRAAQPAG